MKGMKMWFWLLINDGELVKVVGNKIEDYFIL